MDEGGRSAVSYPYTSCLCLLFSKFVHPRRRGTRGAVEGEGEGGGGAARGGGICIRDGLLGEREREKPFCGVTPGPRIQKKVKRGGVLTGGDRVKDGEECSGIPTEWGMAPW